MNEAATRMALIGVAEMIATIGEGHCEQFVDKYIIDYGLDGHSYTEMERSTSEECVVAFVQYLFSEGWIVSSSPGSFVAP